MSAAALVPWRLAAPEAAGAGALFASAVRRLDALAFDGESENIRVLLGGPSGGAKDYRAAAAELERYLTAVPASAWAHALRGKALLNAGEAAGAAEALEHALRIDAGLAHAYLWRAQASLLSGRAPEALRDLGRFESVSGGNSWSHFMRGVALSMSGDPRGARRQWKTALRWTPGSVAARAMLGLGRAGEGHARAGVKDLELAARGGGKQAAYVFGLKGMVERQLGDLESSRASLDRAIRSAPSPWLYSHRADVLNRMGFYQEAMRDLSRLAKLAPSQPQAYVQAANVLFDQAFYDEALKAMDAAIALDPGAGGLHARKARMLWVAGRVDEAFASAHEARRRAPDDAQIAGEWAQLAAVSGREGAAIEELRRPRWQGSPLKDLYLGLAASRAEDRPKARRHFLSASQSAAKSGDHDLAQRAGFYALVSRILEEKCGPFSGLDLISVGARHPYQITVEAVRRLGSCREIFNNVPDPQIMEFLALFPGRGIAVPRRPGEDPKDRARWILDASRTRRLGFVTRVHPFIYRRIGRELYRQAAERGMPVRAGAAVSLTELALGTQPAAGPLNVFDMGRLLRDPSRLDPTRATVVYCLGTVEERLPLCAETRRRYPRRHGVFLLGGAGDRELAAAPIPLRRLEAALRSADSGCVLYLPPVRPTK